MSDDWVKDLQDFGGQTGGGSGDKTSFAGDVARGLAKGAASNVTGLWSGATNLIDAPRLGPPKALTDWVDAPGDTTETIAHTVGDYGSLALTPGLDLGLGAKFGAKAAQWALEHGPSIQTLAKAVGPERAQRMIHGLWDTLPKVGKGVTQGAVGGVAHDPEHPVAGATTGAMAGGAGMAARQAIPAAIKTIPPEARHLARTIGGTAAGFGLYDAARHAMGHGWFPGEYHLAYTLPSALAALAAFATGRPAAMGAAATSYNRGTEPKEETNQPQLPF